MKNFKNFSILSLCALLLTFGIMSCQKDTNQYSDAAKMNQLDASKWQNEADDETQELADAFKSGKIKRDAFVSSMLQRQDASDQAIAVANQLFADIDAVRERHHNTDERKEALTNLLDRFQTSIDDDRDLSQHDKDVLSSLARPIRINITIIVVCYEDDCWVIIIIQIFKQQRQIASLDAETHELANAYKSGSISRKDFSTAMLRKQDVSEQGIDVANNLFTDMETIMESRGNQDESREALNNLLNRYQTEIDGNRELSQHDQQVLAKLIVTIHIHIEITVCNARRCWLAAVIDIFILIIIR